MNKIFKTKYDITTGQCKAVSELASNRQIASSSKSKPKCGGFLGMFKACLRCCRWRC
ncbi:ESPR domain-containing protein [Histophilus somni]|nr:ESPR domain-containing protein [Histophilus somni]